MTICHVLLGLGAAALFFYVREKLRAYTLKAVFLKSAASLLFIALAVCAAHAAGARDALPGFVLLGLVCGLLGDVWLDLKYVFPEQDRAFTYAGFASFALGHVFYITGMALRFCPRGSERYVVVPLALGAALGAGNLLLEKPMKLDYGALRTVVAAYGMLLFSLVLVSGSLALLHGWRETALDLIFAGSILFAASDFILSGTYFGVGRERPADLILNYLTYYPAQFLIAYSLLYLR